MSMRVPTADVSVVDLCVRAKMATDYDSICSAMETVGKASMSAVLGYTDEQLVSSDFTWRPSKSYF